MNPMLHLNFSSTEAVFSVTHHRHLLPGHALVGFHGLIHQLHL